MQVTGWGEWHLPQGWRFSPGKLNSLCRWFYWRVLVLRSSPQIMQGTVRMKPIPPVISEYCSSPGIPSHQEWSPKGWAPLCRIDWIALAPQSCSLCSSKRNSSFYAVEHNGRERGRSWAFSVVAGHPHSALALLFNNSVRNPNFIGTLHSCEMCSLKLCQGGQASKC